MRGNQSIWKKSWLKIFQLRTVQVQKMKIFVWKKNKALLESEVGKPKSENAFQLWKTHSNFGKRFPTSESVFQSWKTKILPRVFFAFSEVGISNLGKSGVGNPKLENAKKKFQLRKNKSGVGKRIFFYLRFPTSEN